MGVAGRLCHGRRIEVADVGCLRCRTTKHHNRCTEDEYRQSDENEIALHDHHPCFEKLTADHSPRRGLLSVAREKNVIRPELTQNGATRMTASARPFDLGATYDAYYITHPGELAPHQNHDGNNCKCEPGDYENGAAGRCCQYK
jgi:hypothetical protein